MDSLIEQKLLFQDNNADVVMQRVLGVRLFRASLGVHHVNAQDGASRQYNLSKDDAGAIRELARNFLSSQTDTPESDLTISPKALSISDSGSIISFIGEDFSDHSSRIDRCYVGIYDSHKRTLSVVKRKYNSDSSEDSTPCTKISIYATGKDSTNKPWVSFLSTYSNPQMNDNSDDDIVELYALNLSQNKLCYDEKLTQSVNSLIDNPSVEKVDKLLSTKKISTDSECN